MFGKMINKIPFLTLIFIGFSSHVSAIIVPSEEFHKAEVNRILNRHNFFRKCHEAPSLELDETLSKNAQALAVAFAENQEVKATIGANVFSENFTDKLSELTIGFPVGLPRTHAVDEWYREIMSYDSKNPDAKTARNFTQVVWKSTQKLGVGLAQDENFVLYVVCVYSPVGNIPGEYDYNVLNSVVIKTSPSSLCHLGSQFENSEFLWHPVSGGDTTTTTTAPTSTKPEPKNSGEPENAGLSDDKKKDVVLYITIFNCVVSCITLLAVLYITYSTIAQDCCSSGGDSDLQQDDTQDDERRRRRTQYAK